MNVSHSAKVCLTAAAVFCAAASVASASIVYEPFDYAAGTALSTNGNGWNYVGNGVDSAEPTITSGSLSYPGLPASVGNSVITDASQTGSSRLNLPSAVASGTLYYSMVMQVTDMTGIGTSTAGSFFAGFNNTPGVGTAIGSAGASLQIHQNGSGYSLGIAQATGAANRVFDATAYGTSDKLFVVGSYTFGPDAGDDYSSLYIFANGATVPLTQPASPTVVSTTGGDVATAQLQSFFLRNNGVEPDHIQIDELRIDNSWAGVTGQAVPEPASLSLIGLAGAGLLGRRRRRA